MDEKLYAITTEDSEEKITVLAEFNATGFTESKVSKDTKVDVNADTDATLLIEKNSIVVRIDENQNNLINVTYKKPKVDNTKIIPISVTTRININEIYELRVKEIDTILYVVNNHKSIDRNNDFLRLPVTDKKTGYQIINAVITEIERAELLNDECENVIPETTEKNNLSSPTVNSNENTFITVLEKIGNYAIAILLILFLISGIIWFMSDIFMGNK